MRKVGYVLLAGIASLTLVGCKPQPLQSVSGAKAASAGMIKVNSSGLTSEQQNIKDRIQMDNQPGAIKHLYVISAYSGQVLIYSTVKGKVTSSGKRLLPPDIDSDLDNLTYIEGENGTKYYTDQMPGEDGTYGTSVEYIYWWDSKGVYHQHYIQGGQIMHISSEPLSVKSVTINMELSGAKPGSN